MSLTSRWTTGLLLASLLIFSPSLWAQVPRSVYEKVGAEIQKGEFSLAEAQLRAALTRHPQDAHAMGMLGVVLDQEKKYSEAEVYYHKALKLDPNSVSILNNLANHDMAVGNLREAHEVFLRVVARDPHQANANVQLARMSVAAHRGEQALHYVDALPHDLQSNPAVAILRANALFWAHHQQQAQSALDAVARSAPHDPRITYSVGMTEAGWGNYSKAETWLKHALHDDPGNYDVLYNLGLAALQAGDYSTARQTLNAALARHPHDVDVLFDLGWLDQKTGDPARAAPYLVKAHHLAPKRTDILMLMGQVLENIGFYGDAADAFQQYLKLKPHDDVVRREYGFALARTPEVNKALKILRAYVSAHPQNARGHYELGVAESLHEQDKAVRNLKRAYQLDPKLTAAKEMLAAVVYQQGHIHQAYQIFKSVLDKDPNNYHILSTLGEIDLQLNNPEEALKYLSHAASLAPNDRTTLLRYEQALERTHHHQQAVAVLKRFQHLPTPSARPYNGLISYLSLPPREREAQYMTNLHRQILANPQDTTLQIRWAEALMDEGKTSESLHSYDQILATHPDKAALKHCGVSLLAAGQYREAEKFFSAITHSPDSDAEAILDLAITRFHLNGPKLALTTLDSTPPAARKGDYYLLRAQILDAEGKSQAAATDLTLGLRNSPTRPDLYFQAALFLIQHEKYREVLSVLQDAVKRFPNSRQLLLTQAIAYGIVHQEWKSEKILSQIEAHWPEWGTAYLIHGIILVGLAKMSKAKPLLQTAVALGIRSPLAYYDLALTDMEGFPPDPQSAYKLIQKALQLSPDDPYTQALAGKIDNARKQYPEALAHLKKAIQLWPDMVQAHEALSATYRAMGQRDESIAQLKDVLRIKQNNQKNPNSKGPAQTGIKQLLFSVPSPRPTAVVKNAQVAGAGEAKSSSPTSN